MARTADSRVTFGAVLIAVGAMLLATRFVALETGPAWLLGVGLGLALLAILRRAFPTLVGGMVCLGVGAGLVLAEHGVAELPLGTWLLFALGAAFVGVWLLSLILQMRARWWPAPVGVALLVLGGVRLVRRFALLPPEVVAAVRAWWPAALVAAGIWMVLRPSRS